MCAGAEAREAYLRDVPSPFGCTTCHDEPRRGMGAPFRNGFGFDYVMARQNWSAFCQLDSDRDGLANGIELLDPQCVWRPGQPRPLVRPPPRDGRDPDQCGDGVIQGTEACDGSASFDNDCRSFGYVEGFIECTDDCQLDDSNCIAEMVTVDASPTLHVDALIVDMMVDPASDLGLERLDAETSSERTVNQDTAFVGNLRSDGFDIGFIVSDGAERDNLTRDATMKERPTAPEEFQSEVTGCQTSTSPFDFWGLIIFAIAIGGRS